MKDIKVVLFIVILLITVNVFGQEIDIVSEDACFEFYNGSIDIEFNQYAEDYSLPYSGNYYNVTNGDYEEFIVESNPLIFTGLDAGEYEFQIFISDDELMEFCWEVYEYKISDEIKIDIYNANCYDNNGKIVLNTTNELLRFGTPIETTVFNEQSELISEKNIHTGLTLIKDLAGGNYTLNIKLPNGCEEILPFTIKENQLKIPYEIVSINKSCQEDGSIEINIDPSAGPFNFQWQNMDTGALYYSEDLQNVSNGIYCLSITKIGDKNNCEYSDTCLVIESVLSFRDKEVNHVCDSMSTNGSIVIDTKQDSYIYKWDTNPPETESSLENLGPGKYCVEITDSDNCKHNECFTILALPDSIYIDYDIIGACPDIEGGTISLNLNPLTDNTTVLWDDIDEEEENIYIRNDLSVGIYSVSVSNECGASEENFSLEYDCSCNNWLDDVPIFKKKDDCLDASGDGYINFIETFGISFKWSTGSTHSEISGLGQGTYKVTITHDDSQCEKTLSIAIEEEAPAEVNFSILENACPSGGNGEVEVSILGTYYSFYWNDLGVGNNDLTRNNLDAGIYNLIVKDACGTNTYDIVIPEFAASLKADVFLGCDPFEEITFEVIGDNPPFDIDWEIGDGETLNNVEAGDYKYTITDSKGCEHLGEYEISDPIEEISKIYPCPDISNGSIVFQINNPNNEYLTITYDFGPCGECQDFPLIEPTYDSILVVELDNLPGGVPFTFEIDFGDCHFTKTFTLLEETWDKEFVSSEEIDGIIYCTYDKVCKDIVIEGGFVEPATIDHFSQEDGEGWTLQGFGSCGETNLVCGEDSVGVISEDPIKMRALEARAFYDRLGIVFNEFWEIEIDKNPCRYAWVCPNGNVYPSFFSGNFFGGGEFEGITSFEQEEGCQEIKCKYDFGLFSFNDNFVVCDSFEFLPGWIEPYVNDPDDNEVKCDAPVQLDAFSIINLYSTNPDYLDAALENTELLSFILDNFDNPAQNCATVTFCNDDYTVLGTDIDEIDCGSEILEPVLILDEFGNSIYALPCETYNLDDNNIYSLCPTNCGPKADSILGCWYINVVPKEAELPGIIAPNGGPKSQNRNVVMQPQTESTTFYTYTQYITEYGNQIYKPLNKTFDENTRLNVLLQNSYHTFPLDDIIFSHEDFRVGFQFVITGKEGNYLMTSGNFSNTKSYTIESSDYLKIHSHSFLNDVGMITGEINGQLSFNNEAIVQSDKIIQFSLSVDKSLNIIDVDFSQETQGFIDHSNGKYIEVGTIGSNNNISLNKSSGIEVLEYHFDPKSTKEYIIVKGIGTVSSNSTSINIFNIDELTLLSIQNGDIVWSKKIGKFNSIAGNIPITTDENDNIFIGLSYKNQLEIESLNISQTNQNSFDNIILKLSKNGDFDGYNLISNNSDEFIEELRVVNDNLIFGVTAKGYEFKREIGKNTFYQFDNIESRGISSYILIDEMSPFPHQRNNKVRPIEDFYSIIPNPATNKIFVQCSDNNVQIINVQIFDINGKLVIDIKSNKSNSEIIDISSLLTEVYTISIIDTNNNFSSKKLIITK